MGVEIVHFQDGGRVARTAELERDEEGGGATLSIGQRRVLLQLDTRDPGGAVLKGVTASIAEVAYALLGLFKHWGCSYGDRIAFETDGRRAVALYQEHPADAGKNYPHPGVTLLEYTDEQSAPPGVSSATTGTPAQVQAEQTGASAVDLAIAAGIAVVGVLIFSAAVTGVGLPPQQLRG